MHVFCSIGHSKSRFLGSVRLDNIIDDLTACCCTLDFWTFQIKFSCFWFCFMWFWDQYWFHLPWAPAPLQNYYIQDEINIPMICTAFDSAKKKEEEKKENLNISLGYNNTRLPQCHTVSSVVLFRKLSWCIIIALHWIIVIFVCTVITPWIYHVIADININP